MTDDQSLDGMERASRTAVVHSTGRALERSRPAATYDTVTEDLTGWEFVTTRRWVGYIVLAVVFAIACGFLSLWQLDRARQAEAYNALVSANFNSTPAPLDTVLTTRTSYKSGQEWKRVEVTGTYLSRGQLYVRNRPLNGTPGFEVLTPLRLANGTVFIVDRGWIPTGSDMNYPRSTPRPPAGEVTVIARLVGAEPAIGGKPSVNSQIESIDLTQIEQRLGGQVYTGAYGLLDSQVPTASASLKPVLTSRPTVDGGVHWSYMIQWVLFALIGFFALGYAIRTEFRRINKHDPAEQQREVHRVRKRALKPFTDAEVEDEILDGYISLARWGYKATAISTQPRQTDRMIAPSPRIYALEPQSQDCADADSPVPPDQADDSVST